MYRIKTIFIQFLNNCIRRNKLLTRLLFNVKVPNSDDIHWDFTTLVVKKALNEILKPDFKIPVSDTQAYRQFGNAVVVPVVKSIADKLIKTLKNNSAIFQDD